MIKHLLFIVLPIVLFGCQRSYSFPEEVEWALQKAGQNRHELEKVLNHYHGKDSLKYKSACFLIANMPYHASEYELRPTTQHEAYFRTTDSVFSAYFGRLTTEHIKASFVTIPDSLALLLGERFALLPDLMETEGIPDVETITAKFLIDNIENAFRMWQSSPLLKNMPFDEFKEVILPYRTTDESLIYTKSELNDRYYSLLSFDGFNDIRLPIERLKIFCTKQKRISRHSRRTSSLGLYDLFVQSPDFNCHPQVTWTINLFRSCGIPAVYEYTPLWTNRENRHFWCASPDSNGVYRPYTPPYNNLEGDSVALNSAGKVYRLTFSANRNTPYFLNTEGEFVPISLRNPCLSDQTNRYHPTATLRLPFSEKTQNRLAYLGQITRSGFTPVAWGTIDPDKQLATFEQVPTRIPFVLCYFQADRLTAVGKPFYIDMKANKLIINTLSPNKEFRTSIELTRKYPPKPHLQLLQQEMRSATLIGEINGQSDTIYCFRNIPHTATWSIQLKLRKAYQRYTLQAPTGKVLHIAELEPLSADGKKLHYLIEPALANVFDGDKETFAQATRITMEFTSPTQIASLVLTARNANNEVEAGNRYSLSVFQNGAWHTLAETLATSNRLRFEGVPTNGLYILRNLNKGKEEQPFILYQSRQTWLSPLPISRCFIYRKKVGA